MFKFKYLPHKKEDEEIIFFIHRHWFVVVRYVFVYFLMGILPIGLWWFILREDPVWLSNDLITIFLSLLGFTYYLFWWMMFYHAWLDYFLDTWIVTNYRVINIEQKGLFNRVIAEHKLFRIQDVQSEQKGILPTFLNFGKIDVQTAGTEMTVVFKEVPKPHYIAQEMVKLIELRKKVVAKKMEQMDKLEGTTG